MTWQLYDAEILGNQSQVLLDDGFVENIPGAELPNLAWIDLWRQEKPEGQYWHPEASEMLDRERPAGTRRATCPRLGRLHAPCRSAGLREYFIYSKKSRRIEYCIESEAKPDPKWELIFRGSRRRRMGEESRRIDLRSEAELKPWALLTAFLI